MDPQLYYESARLFVDDLIDDSFRELTTDENRKLSRVWQYLRDQEIVAIQSGMRTDSRLRQRLTPADYASPKFGAGSVR